MEEDDDEYLDLELQFKTMFNSNHLSSDCEKKEEKLILTKEELKKILFEKAHPYKGLNSMNGNKFKYKVLTVKHENNNSSIIENDGVKNNTIEVIQDELLLVVLEYLYLELNEGLIELSDNFIEQRRKYFLNDQETYVKIIKLFLKKKEDFFLGILSEIMSKLNISQQLLDDSFVYYMNSNENSEKINLIKDAYNKVYKAGARR
jgi:hypothetical protein